IPKFLKSMKSPRGLFVDYCHVSSGEVIVHLDGRQVEIIHQKLTSCYNEADLRTSLLCAGEK
ncbi:MAG: hypothetical protein PHQ83_05410, partial [Eubacteriales bacterium]|nr:hypothetical protein [Eubacteriales bacterium]